MSDHILIVWSIYFSRHQFDIWAQSVQKLFFLLNIRASQTKDPIFYNCELVTMPYCLIKRPEGHRPDFGNWITLLKSSQSRLNLLSLRFLKARIHRTLNRSKILSNHNYLMVLSDSALLNCENIQSVYPIPFSATFKLR